MTAYVTQSEDITKDAELFQFKLLRQAGASKRLSICAGLTRSTRQLCWHGMSRRETCADVARNKFIKAVLGFIPPFKVQSDERMWTQNSVELAQQMHLMLESAAIPYYVTGGVASSWHGEPRSTKDLDLVVQANAEDLDKFVSVLAGNGFYIPETALENVKTGREKAINIVNMYTIAGADIIIGADTDFDRSQMSRRVMAEGFYVCSAEDAILQKLRWSQKSLSEKQQRDVLGIIKVQLNDLDRDYLRHWSDVLGVSEQLSASLLMAEIE